MKEFVNRLSLTSIDLAWPAAFALPLWITWGRSFFDAGGWVMLIMTVTVMPLMFALLVVCATNISSARKRGAKNAAFLQLGYWLAATYVSGVVLGLTLLDFGDKNDTATSIVTERFDWSVGASMAVSSISGLVFACALVGAVIVAGSTLRRITRDSSASV